MRIYVPLSDASGDALRRLASQEVRPPQMQAKYLLEEALRARGVLCPEEHDAYDTRADNRATLVAAS